MSPRERQRWNLVRRGARDDGLSRSALRVLAWIAPELQAKRFTPVKLLWVARHLQLDESTVSRAVCKLAESGYVERDRAGPGAVVHGLRWAPDSMTATSPARLSA